MDTEKWKQIEKALNEALDLDGRERKKFLSQIRADNPEIYYRVTELLDSIEEAEDTLFLESGSSENAALVEEINYQHQINKSTERLIGKKIGPFTLTDFLGRGGMAVVYKGERMEGSFNQTVAVKILNKNFYSEESMLRFRTEQQILSRLNHPHIARLTDGGVTDEGNPYLIMEYVNGVPITTYCKNSNSTVEECHSLFNDLCTAVNYAHRNMVVHRDLKPDNILVTTEGKVKVLDFSIAKLLDTEFADQPVIQTQTGVKLLSPIYCAPEQFGNEPITTSTDVFALGLMLYELVTGQKAVSGKDKTLTEIETVICRADFSRPTTINPRIDSELESIILKALRKEPEYRYDTAGQVMEDLERYQKSLPLLAQKDTIQYRMSKFMKRNSKTVAATLVLLLVLLTLGSYHVHQIDKQRDMAELEAEKARTTLSFMIGIFEKADPNQQSQRDITAREILEDGTAYINTEIKDQPEIRASLLDAVGNIYKHLGMYEKAEPLLSDALEIRRGISVNHNRELALSIQSLASYEMDTGDYKRAIQHFNEAADMFKVLDLKSDYAKSIQELGWIYYLKGDYNRADSLVRSSLNINQVIYGSQSKEVARSYQYLAWNQNSLGNYEAADSLFRKTLAVRKVVFDENHPLVAETHNSLGRVLYNEGNYTMAEKNVRKALKMRQQIFNDNHPDIASSLKLLGLIKVKLQEYEEAEFLLSGALEIFLQKYGDEHKNTINTRNDLATIHFYRKDYAQAADMFRKVVASNQKILRVNHPELATSFNNLALTLQMAGKKDESLQFYHRSLNVASKNYDTNHPYLIQFRKNIAALYEELGRFEAATKYWLKNYQVLKNKKGAADSDIRETLKHLITCYQKTGDNKRSEKYERQLTKTDSG